MQPEAAIRIARLAETRNVRRLLATMPMQLIGAVRERLPAGESASFDAAVAGLGHVDLPRRPSLTSSEARVLNALPLHRSTADLAAVLHVSPNTIKTQLRSLYRKLGCTNRGDAIEIAVRLRLTGLEAE